MPAPSKRRGLSELRKFLKDQRQLLARNVLPDVDDGNVQPILRAHEMHID